MSSFLAIFLDRFTASSKFSTTSQLHLEFMESQIRFESFPKMMLLAISGIIAGDFFSEWVRLLVGKRITNPIIAIESSCVRFSNDLGRVKAVVQSLKPWRITERFDYAATGEWIWGERKWAFTRFFVQTVVTLSLIDLLT